MQTLFVKLKHARNRSPTLIDELSARGVAFRILARCGGERVGIRPAGTVILVQERPEVRDDRRAQLRVGRVDRDARRRPTVDRLGEDRDECDQDGQRRQDDRRHVEHPAADAIEVLAPRHDQCVRHERVGAAHAAESSAGTVARVSSSSAGRPT